jgi:hypothetical protein
MVVPSESDMERDIEQQAVTPLFDGAALERI